MKFIVSICLFLFSFVLISCADKEASQEVTIVCGSYKNYASATFEVSGDMTELVEKSAKKALTKSCYKKSESSNSNLRIKIQSTKSLNSEIGFIKDKHENTLQIEIAVIILIPNADGGLTTLTRKQNAKLNLKSQPIAGIGDNAELTDKEAAKFVEQNVSKALSELFVDIP